jgi:precorrin-4/cobalt-precorrin-4 C11-methyltransferase
MPEGETLAAFAATGATLAVHLSIQNLGSVVADLTPILGPDCPVAVIWRATWPEQRVVPGTLADIATRVGDSMERTALILIGRALAGEGFEDSKLYAEDYDRRFRPQSATSVYRDSRE